MAASSFQEWQKIKELVEQLAGLRGDPSKAAIRMAKIGQLNELIGSLKGSATDLQQKVNVLDDQIANTQQQVGTLQNTVNFLQGDVDAVQLDVTGLQENVATIQQGLSDAQLDLDTINQQITDIQTDLNGLADVKDRLDTLQADVGAVSVPAMTQGPVAAPPTAAQFNALVTDVGNLRQALLNLISAIQ